MLSASALPAEVVAMTDLGKMLEEAAALLELESERASYWFMVAAGPAVG
jgi:hypothetical protein